MQERQSQKDSGFNGKYLLLYIPFVLSSLMASSPTTSYYVAWLGSFFIFYLSFANKIKKTHEQTSFAEKILRPLFITQLIFAGYMACTSIFNFMDHLGYEYFTRIPYKTVDPYEINLTAACQRYYALGHAAMVHGMLTFYKSDIVSPFKIRLANWPAFFIKFGVIAGVLGFAFSKVGSLAVLATAVQGLAFIASTIGFALAIPLRQTGLIFVSGLIFGSNLLRALTSGFKEPVIVSFLMLGIFLYPFYKRIILTVFVPLMLFLFAVLPTYVNTFRAQQSGGAQDAETAKAEALQKVREGLSGDELAETNWAFLTDRISEVGMFIKYKENIDEGANYYGFEILGQALMNLVPRIVWKEKPLTEQLVLKRVLENGIVEEYALTSAKPSYIVDSYLSFGVFGIWFFLFLYGVIAQIIANKSEHYFGGYVFGIAFVYTGAMSVLWRGNCFEFIFSSIIYGLLVMWSISLILKRLKVLVPI